VPRCGGRVIWRHPPWEFARKRPMGTMQWMSLFLVVSFGGITLLTNDPRFVMIKPSLIYKVVGVVYA
jgi:intracellular septation protein